VSRIDVRVQFHAVLFGRFRFGGRFQAILELRPLHAVYLQVLVQQMPFGHVVRTDVTLERRVTKPMKLLMVQILALVVRHVRTIGAFETFVYLHLLGQKVEC
jgi:hypothetical protein